MRGVLQTNPIPPGRDEARRTNKPNLPPPDGQAGPWLEPIAPNKPNSSRGGLREPHYSSIPSFHHSNPMAILPNKANLPGQGLGDAGRGQLYKQSQFPPRRQDRQGLGREGVMVNSTFDGPRRNKANCLKRGTEAVSGGWDAFGGTTGRAVAWARCAKQTQSAPEGPGDTEPCAFGTWHVAVWVFGGKNEGNEGGQPAIGQDKPAVGSSDQLCETNPIVRRGRAALPLPSTLRPRLRHRMPIASSVSGGVTFCLNPRHQGGYNPL